MVVAFHQIAQVPKVMEVNVTDAAQHFERDTGTITPREGLQLA